MLQKRNDLAENVTGISPFEAAGDSVTRYQEEVDYLADTLKNFEFFSLSKPNLLKAYSTDKAAAEFIATRSWDCLYIDGNHDYEVAKADWQVCAANVKPGGLIVLDDSGLNTNYHPPIFATGGHPGPSQVAREISRSDFREILQVGHNRVFQRIEP
jgi:predicted O-methyltransferase YrrM